MIFVFGTICLDRLLRVPALPSAGGYVEITDETVNLGGEAANTATALVSWGVDVVLAGNSLGSGVDGALLSSLLREKGLPMDLLSEQDDFTTPVCDIYVTPDGERTMFGKGFSTMRPIQSLESLPFVAGKWFTAEPNMGAVAREAVCAASEHGMKTYLMDFIQETDPVPEGSFWQSSTDWAGHRNNMQRNVQWVKAFVAKHGCFTILSDGPNGFVAGSPVLPVRTYPPYPAPEVVDTTGAGDMFRAGMLFGLENGWSISRCLQYAAAAGCLKCRALGATTDVPTRAEIEAHIAENDDVSRQYL